MEVGGRKLEKGNRKPVSPSKELRYRHWETMEEDPM